MVLPLKVLKGRYSFNKNLKNQRDFFWTNKERVILNIFKIYGTFSELTTFAIIILNSPTDWL